MHHVPPRASEADQFGKEELRVLLRELDDVFAKGVPGDIVELGCYDGTTSVYIARLIRERAEKRAFHIYDSFSGLPPKSRADESPAGTQFKAGELLASKNTVIKRFKQAGLPLPAIHRAWFNELTSSDVPEQIAFAFLDGDFYDSIHDSLRLIWGHRAPGAVIVIDDYQSESLPGVHKAVTDWLATHPAKLRTQASLAIIT